MLKQIVNQKDRKKTDIDSLKKSKRPVIMYGAGSYAVDVSRFLQKHNISIAAYCVDKLYIDKDVGPLKPLYAIEELPINLQAADIVIGFADYVKARERIAVLGYKRNIYFIDAPNQESFFDYSYIKSHETEFEETYNMLADQKSKDIFIAFINSKISGDPSRLYKYCEFNQYFCDLIKLNQQEVFVDCGAYDGDTLEQFIKRSRGHFKQIYSLEPDEENYKKLTQKVNQIKAGNIKTYNLGAWSKPATLSFSSEGNVASLGDQGDVQVQVDSIDNLVKGQEVTYIKMDIEGAELEALKGAKTTIKRYLPKLAICAYHKPEDLITLPQYIKNMSAGYKIYLRHHQYMSWEMVMYAVQGNNNG